MASIIAMTSLWCEPNPHSSRRGGYNPAASHRVQAIRPGSCPCDACPKRDQCRDEALACQEYAEWVNPNLGRKRGRPIEARRIPGKAFL